MLRCACRLALSSARQRPSCHCPAISQRIVQTSNSTPCLSLRYLPSARSFLTSSYARETVKVPQLAESLSEGTLKSWLKKKGDHVEVDEEVATIETDKIDVSVNAPTAGTITELLANEEDTVAVGQDLFKIEPGAAPEGGAKSEDTPKEDSKKPEPKKEESAKEEPKEEAASTESRRRKPESAEYERKETEPSRAQAEVQPSKLPEPSQQPKSSPQPAQSSKSDAKSSGSDRTERRVKMNSMRKRIAERLKQSQNAAASLTTFNEVDMTALMELRKRYKDRILKETGVKVGFMSAFAKAACMALKEFPAANAAIEGPGPGEQIVYRDYVDLSVAVATPKGLVTPVIRNAESMTMLQIERSIADLGKKARDNKLTIEDMTGGTFTISNGGVFGSLYGTPIINLPQAAVLGMHSIKEKPYVVNGQIVIRPIMIVALTYDHRLLDGREAVSVLVRMKEYLEDPGFMLLNE